MRTVATVSAIKGEIRQAYRPPEKVEPPQVNVAPASVKVDAPVVNVAAPNVTVQPPVVNVAAPSVSVDAPDFSKLSDIAVAMLARLDRKRNYTVEIIRDAKGQLAGMNIKEQ